MDKPDSFIPIILILAPDNQVVEEEGLEEEESTEEEEPTEEEEQTTLPFVDCVAGEPCYDEDIII